MHLIQNGYTAIRGKGSTDDAGLFLRIDVNFSATSASSRQRHAKGPRVRTSEPSSRRAGEKPKREAWRPSASNRDGHDEGDEDKAEGKKEQDVAFTRRAHRRLP
jgi:hypothetical protein